ncbi:MAG: hypothetical protein MZW92_70200 [Comamonadaceae bacterium]|nr:hypothetical protein [Comamonadaceae bacterium]
MTEPAPRLTCQCLDTRGLHRMAYWEWGDAAQPARAGLRARPDAPGARLRHAGARPGAPTTACVCPDVVGRGRSDRLADPMGYAIPQLRGRHGDAAGAAGRARRCDWVGTSMGGLIGLGAGQPGRLAGARGWCSTTSGRRSSRRRSQRIGSYLGQPVRWATLDEAADALLADLAGLRPAHARAVAGADAAAAACRRRRGGFMPHYDPAHRRAVPRRDARDGRGRRGRCCGSATTACAARRCCCAAPSPTCCRTTPRRR